MREHKEGFDKFKDQNITALVDAALKARVKVMLFTTVIGEDLNEEHNETLVCYNQFLRALARERQCLWPTWMQIFVRLSDPPDEDPLRLTGFT